MTIVQERREVSGFDEIQMEGTGELILTQGEEEGLVIEADGQMLPKLKSDVNAGRLELGLRHWYDLLSLIGATPIRYTVTVRSLRGVTISGAGTLQSGAVQAERLRLRINGSGEMNLAALSGGELDISIAGSGKVQVGGSVQRQEIDISGSGDILAEDLACQEASVRISGSGSARLRVDQRLTVNISGSGDVCYFGHPQIQQRISGSGSVRSLVAE
jgi:hypothetical protein